MASASSPPVAEQFPFKHCVFVSGNVSGDDVYEFDMKGS
jgi:hypothetical protein